MAPFVRALPAALVLACADPGVDLPAGWADATPVDDLVQTPCADDASPYEPFDVTVSAEAAGDAVVVDVTNAHFRCAQDVEGFVREGPGTADLLVQPIDMDPDVVAGCDCLYDLGITVRGLAPGETAVAVYRRWDDLNDPNPPVPIGEAAVVVP